jgi:LemA protein
VLRDRNQEGKSVAPWVLIGVPMLLALAAIRGYNNLLALRQRARIAWSPLEAQLRSRSDLVQQWVERESGGPEHEGEALEGLMKVFHRALHAEGIPARGEAENELSETLRGFFAMAGANPEVRAAQEELIAAEERIAFARRSYNDQVMAWNIRIARFPWRLISRPAGLDPAEYFVMDEPRRREAPPGTC